MTPETLFTPFVMLVSILFAGFIFVRKPRVEWVALVGAVFASNAANQAGDMLVDLFGAGEWAYQASKVFDRATIFLLFWLGMAYPRQPRWFRGRASWFTAGMAVAFVVYLGLYILAKQTYSSRLGLAEMPWYGVLFEFLFPSIPFLLIATRWTLHFLREESPLLRRQNQFMLAAFGTRAIHVMVTFPLFTFTTYHSGLLAVGGAHTAVTAIYLVIEGLKLLVVPAVFAVLLFARSRKPLEERRSIDFVLVFFLFGLGEALILDTGLPIAFLVGTLSAIDVVVIRPVLIWYAMARYELLGRRVEAGRIGLVLLGILGFASFLAGSYAALDDRLGDLALAASVGIAVILTAVLVSILRPVLRRSLEAPNRAQSIEVYVSAAEDAYRNQGYASEWTRLEDLRATLGISREQAEALEEAVRTRWSHRPDRDWLAGDRILGRYQIERLLGEGGHAEAYLARDLLEDAPVVLKRTRRLDPASRRSLLDEAAALARLRHPNIVRMIRTEHVASEPVLVLEHVAGGSLASRLAREGRLPPAEARRVALQILEALHAAHKAGLVHRDLKPSNVLLSADGAVKVSDFGLAGPLPGAATFGHPTASVGLPTGTLRYMAPEQVKGLPATPQSDLYSAALILQECMAGQVAVPTGLSDFETRRWIVEGPPVQVPASWPEGLRQAVEQGLSRDPDHRPPSARALAALL